MLDCFEGGFCAGAHQDNDAFGVGCANIVERPVVTARELPKLLHRGRDNVGARGVERIDRLAALEIDVRVLRGAADKRFLRVQGAGAMVGNQLVADHGPNDLVGNHFDFVDFVRGAETIEEVHERHARLEGRGLGDERGIHDLLYAVGGQHGPANLPAGHDVLMVAKDGERGGSEGTGCDMENGRGQFPGNFVHVGDHQQETLRGGKGGGQRARLQRAVYSTGSTAF